MSHQVDRFGRSRRDIGDERLSIGDERQERFRDDRYSFDDRGRRDSKGPYVRGNSRERSAGPIAPTLSIHATPSNGSRLKLGPMKNFKNFVTTQPDELSVEEYKRRYDEYCIEYVNDFSEECFHDVKSEEWFQNRYNPLNLHAINTEVSSWAIAESTAFRSEVLSDPVAAVGALRLDADCAPQKSLTDSVDTSKPASADAVVKDAEKDSGDATKEDPPAEEKSVPESSDSKLTGPHIPGHSNRTIAFSGIPLACTKLLFASQLNSILSKSLNQSEMPVRVLVSHPYWNVKDRNIFEKSAWAVLPSAEAAVKALKLISGKFVDAEYPSDRFGRSKPNLRFQLVASLFVPGISFCRNASSSSAQVESDRQQALELAAALDEERLVNSESRLENLITNENFIAACVRPTDVLDVVIGYLRRVHFVSFYEAYKYRDEGHLLLQSACIYYRSVPYFSSKTQIFEPVPSATNPETSCNEDDDSNKRKREIDDEESPSKPAAVAVTSGVFSVNPYITEMIKKSKDRRPGGSTEKTLAEDVEAINNKVNEALMKEIEELAAKEEGRVRCWFDNCSKLFKGPEFLCKHIMSKHGVQDLMLHVCETYMHSRYHEDKLLDRPMPMVAVEVSSGEIEFKFAKEIIEKHSNRPSFGNSRGFVGGNRNSRGPYKFDRNEKFDRERRGSFNGNISNNFRPRNSWSGNRQDSNPSEIPRSDVSSAVPDIAGAVNSTPVLNRRIISYSDIDAPKDSVVDIDYGVAILPPVKKKKVTPKKE